jgi:hypothetical protein
MNWQPRDVRFGTAHEFFFLRAMLSGPLARRLVPAGLLSAAGAALVACLRRAHKCQIRNADRKPYEVFNGNLIR